DVARSLELQPTNPGRAAPLVRGVQIGGFRVPTPTDVQWPDAVLVARADAQKAGAVRREQPLVRVAAVEVGPYLGQAERYERGGVCPVDDGQNAAPPCLLTKFARRQNEAGRREDVAEEEDARARRHGPGGGGDDLVGGLGARGQREGAEVEAEPAGGTLPAP